MKTSTLSISTALLLTLAAAGCATQPADGGKPKKTLDQELAERGFQLGDEVDGIMQWEVDGWNRIDDEHVVFNAGPSRNYMVTVMTPCQGLEYAMRIGFTSTNSQLSKFDKLIVHDNGFTDRCPITKLNKLNKIKKS
ncbi:DUF6491 family protein [Solimonas marina]|uniref:Lipoprotein n=1 Tax=Solimonas marina TaxID=2714601 RepID=A0A970B5A0_9GAMM|nr:DUF6491 family protein [Solimonas marina]NKF21320.1 hypothetical protein [Solimonas marina]